jgi:ribosomal protein S18 acetylase RimI-like enzyme
VDSPGLESNFEFQIIRSFCIDKIKIINNNKEIGFISCLKLKPFAAVLYDFFIMPQYRGNGYGRLLLEFAIARLNNQIIKTIFIQPGPFDIVKNQIVSIKDNQKIEKLIKLYKSAGFKEVNTIFSKIVLFFYKLLQIPEDPKFLMYI